MEEAEPRRMSLPPLFEHWHHCLANEVGVALGIIFEFGRDGVRAKKGEGQVERGFIVEHEQGFEQTKFGGGLQTIARFGFDGRGSHARTCAADAGVSVR